jgi:Polyketide cyclase / dehydrase and lipid transport
MRALKIIGYLVLLIAALFVFGGLLIPKEWTVSRSITIQAAPEQIFPYVNDFQEWHQWSPWNESKDPSLKFTYSGPATGPEAKQSWTSDNMGEGWMQITSSCQPMGVSYDLFIDMEGNQSNLFGNLLFKQRGDGTEVTWTDRGNSGNSWMNRWMSLLIQSMLGGELETGLASLKNLVEGDRLRTLGK